MKVAVLMSTYNGHIYLNQQLESLSNQTVADKMTVYIRDDGSTDDTFEIIEKWKSKLSIVMYKGKNAGPAMSFWLLLMNSEIKADYYAFCDQDDVWDSDKMEVAINHLNGDTHFYACNCRIIDEKGFVTDEKRCKEVPDISIRRLFISGVTQGCSMVFDDALRQYIVEKEIQCIPMHDVVLMLYAMNFGKIYWDQEPHFSYRVHSNNVVAKSNKSILKKIKTTWWNWKNSSKNSMGTVAKEFIMNEESLSEMDKYFLKRIANYKKNKIKVINLYKNERIEKSTYRSFLLRIVLELY